MKGDSWSKTETLVLRQMWLEHKTATVIGKALGRSRCSVLGKIRRLGLARNPRTKPFKRTHWHCGHPATAENTTGAPKGNRCKRCSDALRARNRAFAADYLGGMSPQEVADKHGVKKTLVLSGLAQAGAVLSGEERRRRWRAAAKARKRSGRPPVWPDCPPEKRAEYDRLRHNYGYRAADARAMLEAAA